MYSLVASRIGAIATEFTDTEIASLQAEIASSAGVSVAGVAKADTRARIGSTQTQQAQVVRKALVQSTFRDLHEYERERLRLSPITNTDLPRIDSERDLFSHDDLAPWVIPSKEFLRGDLIEAEVELGADPIFRMSAVVSAITEIVREAPELRAAAGADMEQASALARVIERLLVGLVPLRGRLVDFDVATATSGVEYLAHRSVLEQAQSTVRLPLFLVGVAEEGLFWKDVRRVLFSGSRYRVLCRLARPGTQRTWTPVKLVDVLREFTPELATQLNELAASMAAAASVTSAGSDSAGGERWNIALTEYAAMLLRHYGEEVAQTREVVDAVAVPELGGDTGLEHRRRAFSQVTRTIEQTLSVKVDPIIAAQLRHAAWLESDPAYGSPDISAASDGGVAHHNERYLDVEFVAIYW